MRSEIIPEGDEFRHPLFVNTLPFTYRIQFKSRRKHDTLIYSTPHEIILNMHAFTNTDQVTYINRSSNQDLFTITIQKFKSMLSESIYNVSISELELLYMRLLLTNHYSKAIIDRGFFRFHDKILRDYLITIKGGFDSYLTYENKKVKLYLKYRRLSCIHLLAVLQEWKLSNSVNISHINIPKSITSHGLLYECLRVESGSNGFRLYNYSPVPEDNLLTTAKFDSEIIQIINQLIK